jgi:hypothetical protein
MPKEQSIKELFAEVFGADNAGVLTEEFAAFARDIAEMERPQTEKEKLRKKDEKLILRINDLFNAVFNASRNGDITRTEAILLFKIYILFNLTERILWELKGETGNPPGLPEVPEPPPPPPPKPAGSW